MQRTGKSILLAVLWVALAACAGPAEPLPPAVPLAAPAPYAMWWALAEACSGRRGDFAAVRWYVVPGVSEFRVGGHTFQGYWDWTPVGSRIILAEARVVEGRLVRHEMLHALTRRAGHAPADFAGRCGGVVACDGACAAEVGQAPPPGPAAPELEATDLEVTLGVYPADVALGGAAEAWSTVTVTARNPRPEPVWVRMRLSRPDAGANPTFGYELAGAGRLESYLWTHDDRMPFGPGEAKRFTFDVRLASGPGTYDVRGYFNTAWAPPAALAVTP